MTRNLDQTDPDGRPDFAGDAKAYRFPRGRPPRTNGFAFNRARAPKRARRIRYHADDVVFAEELQARAAELGAPVRASSSMSPSPMLCSSDALRLDHDDYVYELKLDGVRVVAELRDAGTSLTYRSGRAADEAYPEIADAIRDAIGTTAVLDGEVVAIGQSGFPDFELLGQRIHIQRAVDARRIATSIPVVFMAFDLLQIGAHDLRGLALEHRKAMLQRLLAGRSDGLLQYVDHWPRGTKLFELCVAKELEGVVAKRKGSLYREGPYRGPDWVKIKRTRDANFVVIAWTEGTGSRGDLGALELATYAPDGTLVVRGRVGSGLALETRNALLSRLMAIRTPECAARGPLKAGKVRHFVRPEIVVSVRFKGWSNSGKLVAPVFLGLCSDVATDCREEPRSAASAPL